MRCFLTIMPITLEHGKFASGHCAVLNLDGLAEARNCPHADVVSTAGRLQIPISGSNTAVAEPFS